MALKGFGRPDILHDNGIWLPHHHQLSAFADQQKIPRVVSIRGMLEPWATNHKKWKKMVAWWIYQRRDLAGAHCHHVTSETEARNVRRFGFDVPIRVVANGVDLPENQLDQGKSDMYKRDAQGRRIALFLGRIYPVKGLPMLIEAWANVRPQSWVLHIAGPDEAGHKKEVEAMVHTAGLGDLVSFLGPVGSEEKKLVYRTAELFVLPTHTENFGMVIGEALAYGVPVLTTKGAPWPILPVRRCGWWVDATVAGLSDGLAQATLCDPQTLLEMGERGRKLIKQSFEWDSVAKHLMTVYEELLTS